MEGLPPLTPATDPKKAFLFLSSAFLFLSTAFLELETLIEVDEEETLGQIVSEKRKSR